MKKIYLLLFSIALVYLLTISNSIFGGDAGDLVSAVLTKGSAHPPGYPLYIILGILFKLLPIGFLTTAGKITLVSTFSTIFSFLFLALIIKEIAGNKLNRFLLAVTLLIISSNYLVWLYAVVPEVFPLNTFISLSIFYFAVKFYKTIENKYLYFFALFIGLGISHHHTFVLVLPSALFLLYKKRKSIKLRLNNLLLSLTCFAAGLLPLLYLIYTGFKKADVLWDNPSTLNGFVSLIFRLKYGTFVASPLVLTSPQQRLMQLKNLLSFIQDDFSLLAMIFFVLCVVLLFKVKRSLIKDLLTAVIISAFLFGPFFVFYANFPLLNGYYFATIERFFLTFYFFFTILIYFGLFYLIENIIKPICKSYINNPFLKKFTLYITLILLLFYPVGMFIKSFPIIYSLKNDKTAENLGLDVLNNVLDNSIIFLSSDNVSFTTQYVYYDRKESIKDKVFVHSGKFGFYNYLDTLLFHYPQLKNPKNKKNTNQVLSLIEANKDYMNIYSENLYDLKPFEDYEWVSQGILFKLEKKGKTGKEENLKNIRNFWANSLNTDLIQQVKKDHLKFKNFFTADILKIYSSSHNYTALYLLNNNLTDEAYKHLKQATELDKYDPDINNHYYFAKYYIKKRECVKAEAEITQALSEMVTQNFIRQLKDVSSCYTNEKDKKRIEKKLKQYILKKNIPLEKF